MYHVIIYTPAEAVQRILDALTQSGAGAIGSYDACSFSSVGTGRFRPNKQANPSIGTPGIIESVKEERIEVCVEEQHIKNVLHAVLAVHPYEEPAIHVLPMVDYKTLL